jgi:hypothetical protein
MEGTSPMKAMISPYWPQCRWRSRRIGWRGVLEFVRHLPPGVSHLLVKK